MLIMNYDIMYLARYNRLQEIHTTADLDFLVLSYKIPHKDE